MYNAYGIWFFFYIRLVILMNMLLVYIAICDDESLRYKFYQVNKYLFSPIIITLTMWGYGATLKHCTCRLGMGLFVSVVCFVDMKYWTQNVHMTLWWCLFVYDHDLYCCDSYILYTLVCALKTFKWISMVSKEGSFSCMDLNISCACTHT